MCNKTEVNNQDIASPELDKAFDELSKKSDVSIDNNRSTAEDKAFAFKFPDQINEIISK